MQNTVQKATGLPIPIGILSRGGGNPAPSRGSQWVDGGQSKYIRGRYSQPASNPGAFVDSGGRVFPTRRNSGLSGTALRASQESFARIRLLEGNPVETIRGQAGQAGLGVRGNNARLADPGAENAIQRALQSFNQSRL